MKQKPRKSGLFNQKHLIDFVNQSGVFIWGGSGGN